VIPDGRQEAVFEVELDAGGDYHRMGSPGQLVHLLDRQLIDLVVHLPIQRENRKKCILNILNS
jgi:hypothetical protein